MGNVIVYRDVYRSQDPVRLVGLGHVAAPLSYALVRVLSPENLDWTKTRLRLDLAQGNRG